ncbi:hypothetical protein POTOM_035895 [Populus tomentosa]|uniref:DUF4228 domain protein n=1 Tax=Populus tomentosa TaxID=118781 RepID=A0A8X7Z177_POPTO|nr:hypothetical protein POTOM_035895 [Populus tomentosa]
MGNCQTIDAAALVIQHPSGKIERLYCPVSVSEVMRMNPGHYVSLIIPLPVSGDQENQEHVKTVQFTRVKLLRPSNTLALGHAYRLVTTQEVMKVLQAKKYAKLKGQQQPESVDKNKSQLQEAPEKKQSTDCEARKKSNTEKDYKVSLSLSPALGLSQYLSQIKKQRAKAEYEDRSSYMFARNFGTCCVSKHERHRHRTPSINSASLRSKSWRPSLQSISEAGS